MFNYFFGRNIDCNLDPKRFAEKLMNEKNAVILDVRTLNEFRKGHMPDAVNLDIHNENFQKHIKALDKTKSYFVYCRSGSRSYSAAKFMKDAGFNSVYNLEGGILNWTEELEK